MFDIRWLGVNLLSVASFEFVFAWGNLVGFVFLIAVYDRIWCLFISFDCISTCLVLKFDLFWIFGF